MTFTGAMRSALLLLVLPAADGMQMSGTSALEAARVDRSAMVEGGVEAMLGAEGINSEEVAEGGTEEGLVSFFEKYPHTRFSLDKPGFVQRFDWKATRVSHFKNKSLNDLKKNPKTVFASTSPDVINFLIKTLEKDFKGKKTERVLYLSGDNPLSKIDKDVKSAKGKKGKKGKKPVKGKTAEKLQKLFTGGVWYESFDVAKKGFRAAPVGLNAQYMKPLYTFAETAIAAATVEDKPRMALAAWGRFHPELDDKIPARQKLAHWVDTDPAVEAGIEHKTYAPKDFWAKLRLYKFLLVPRSGSVQSPRLEESLLLLTVPIVTREGEKTGSKEAAYKDLKLLGYPMVVLDDWSDITAPKLDQWWEELHPKLESFRKNCLTTEGFWKMVTGQVEKCE